jgi:hypothetical protein
MPPEMRRFDEASTAHQDAAGIFRGTDGYSEGIALSKPQNGSVASGYMKQTDTQLNVAASW